LYGHFYPHLKSSRLALLVEECGLQSALDTAAARFCPSARCAYHAALYDSLAGALLLAALAREPRIAGLSMMQLLAFSTFDPEKRDALQQGQLF
jgi:hypothetical protein